jgi:hypothetical protein
MKGLAGRLILRRLRERSLYKIDHFNEKARQMSRAFDSLGYGMPLAKKIRIHVPEYIRLLYHGDPLD